MGYDADKCSPPAANSQVYRVLSPDGSVALLPSGRLQVLPPQHPPPRINVVLPFVNNQFQKLKPLVNP